MSLLIEPLYIHDSMGKIKEYSFSPTLGDGAQIKCYERFQRLANSYLLKYVNQYAILDSKPLSTNFCKFPCLNDSPWYLGLILALAYSTLVG